MEVNRQISSGVETMTGNKSIDSLRLFVAISIPETIRGEMARVQTELRDLTPSAAVRWTVPHQKTFPRT